MPYVLGERLAEITVLENGDSLGRVTRGCLPEWFWRDIEVDTRTRRLIKTRIMICLADTEPEAAWYRRQPDAPEGWDERVSAGVQTDNENAAGPGDYACGAASLSWRAYWSGCGSVCWAGPAGRLPGGEDGNRASPGVAGPPRAGSWHLEPSTVLRDRTRAAMGTAATPPPPRRIFKIF